MSLGILEVGTIWNRHWIFDIMIISDWVPLDWALWTGNVRIRITLWT